jgi:hypothetical protein
MLIETYRIANMAARKTPPPALFLAPPPLPAAPTDGLERVGALRTEAEAAHAALVAAARREIEALIAERDAVEKRLRESLA